MLPSIEWMKAFKELVNSRGFSSGIQGLIALLLAWAIIWQVCPKLDLIVSKLADCAETRSSMAIKGKTAWSKVMAHRD